MLKYIWHLFYGESHQVAKIIVTYCEYIARRTTLKTFVPITPKNLVFIHILRLTVTARLLAVGCCLLFLSLHIYGNNYQKLKLSWDKKKNAETLLSGDPVKESEEAVDEPSSVSAESDKEVVKQDKKDKEVKQDKEDKKDKEVKQDKKDKEDKEVKQDKKDKEDKEVKQDKRDKEDKEGKQDKKDKEDKEVKQDKKDKEDKEVKQDKKDKEDKEVKQDKEDKQKKQEKQDKNDKGDKQDKVDNKETQDKQDSQDKQDTSDYSAAAGNVTVEKSTYTNDTADKSASNNSTAAATITALPQAAQGFGYRYTKQNYLSTSIKVKLT